MLETTPLYTLRKLQTEFPSGKLEPSKPDIEITKKIKEALKLFDIELLDHIILTEEDYYSFSDEGIL